LRNVKVIEDAFEQIKESTGISSVEEIVTSFIKAEEQNYSLYNYVNMLSTETDQLEESNKEINEHIERIKERQHLSDNERQEVKKEMEAHITSMQNKIDKE
jgi:coiled-coil domain-containing protein 63/114